MIKIIKEKIRRSDYFMIVITFFGKNGD